MDCSSGCALHDKPGNSFVPDHLHTFLQLAVTYSKSILEITLKSGFKIVLDENLSIHAAVRKNIQGAVVKNKKKNEKNRNKKKLNWQMKS